MRRKGMRAGRNEAASRAKKTDVEDEKRDRGDRKKRISKSRTITTNEIATERRIKQEKAR